MKISTYLKPDSVIFPQELSKDKVITALVNRAKEMGMVPDADSYLRAVLEREAIMSTGIGLGIAVPHAKLDTIPDFFVCTAVLEQPVPWDAIDRQPVSAVFLIGGPADRQTDYLKILSKITLVIKNPTRRSAILNARTPEDIVAEFENL